jgi:hypothetical protein
VPQNPNEHRHYSDEHLQFLQAGFGLLFLPAQNNMIKVCVAKY